MIIANIHDCKKSQTINASLKFLILKAWEIINENAALGKYPIDGDNAFVVISKGTTEEKPKRLAEIHHKYLDVQILLTGEETIGYGIQMVTDKPDEDLLAEKDIAFYKQITNEQFVDLLPGDFAIFFPKEIHRPLCSTHKDQEIKKAVLKVKTDYLN